MGILIIAMFAGRLDLHAGSVMQLFRVLGFEEVASEYFLN